MVNLFVLIGGGCVCIMVIKEINDNLIIMKNMVIGYWGLYVMVL